ncbi:MAG: hypothetical protein RBS99_17865, partial [Rhodospirillales bacterium]|nr:hypothetical protein [Rhodospirillales bacterium]
MLQSLVNRLRDRLRIGGVGGRAVPAAPPFLRPDLLPDWSALLATRPALWEEALRRAENGPKVLIATNIGGHGPVSVVESMLAVALTLRGAKVHTLLCDRALPACMRAQYDSNVKPAELVGGAEIPVRSLRRARLDG